MSTALGLLALVSPYVMKVRTLIGRHAHRHLKQVGYLEIPLPLRVGQLVQPTATFALVAVDTPIESLVDAMIVAPKIAPRPSVMKNRHVTSRLP
jgi:hypothetical protein